MGEKKERKEARGPSPLLLATALSASSFTTLPTKVRPF